MIERDLAHLRFLFVRHCKGDRIRSEDIDFILKIEPELKGALESIEIIRESMIND